MRTIKSCVIGAAIWAVLLAAGTASADAGIMLRDPNTASANRSAAAQVNFGARAGGAGSSSVLDWLRAIFAELLGAAYNPSSLSK